MNRSLLMHTKRMIIAIFLVVIMLFIIPVKAATTKSPLMKGDGSGFVTHLGSSEIVEVNSVYEEKATEFRGVWVSPLVGNLGKYISKDQYKNEIISILDTMDYYNMNVMIFHIRIMNDAFYKSNYNKWSSYYSNNPDWEALTWIIEECHKRGIEFHAWMNPYRVTNNVNRDLTELASEFPALNPASNPDNMLKGTNSIILNPGIPAVRDFLLNTCEEVIKNYDVDAIHFDDYFYDAGVDDSKTRLDQGVSSANLANWRREQVDTFIRDLSALIKTYNKENGKSIQLGISPSGVWQSGNGIVNYDNNGNAITNGSNTKTSFEHYGDYLYSDTLKWINEEWIDYILPQTYWAIEHPLCAYYDLLEWWSKVVEYKKVNLYSGWGLYLNDSTGGYSWYTNPKEAYNQAMICNTLKNVKGTAIFDYSAVKSTVTNSSKFVGMKEIWDTPKILPENLNTTRIVPTKVENLAVAKNNVGNYLSWTETSDAKFYVIYRSEKEVTYAPTEVLDIIGHLGSNGKIEFTDTTAEAGKDYYYAVKPQSNSLTLGHGTTIKTAGETTDSLQTLGDFDVLNISDGVIPGSPYHVAWSKITFPYGNQIKYDLYYSLNDGEETKVSNPTYEKYLYNAVIPTTEETTKIKIRLVAYNSIGQTEYIYESNLSKGLGSVKNFECLGDYYTNKEVSFVWTLLDYEDVEYKLQSSPDMSEWTTVNAKKTLGEGSGRFICRLPKDAGSVYYRIMAVKDNEYGYSNIKKIDVLNSLGSFKNIKLDGEEIPVYLIAEEDQLLKITFDKFNADNVTYNISVSDDLEEWMTGRQYSSKFNVDVKNNVVNVNLTVSYIPLKIYVKVTATANSGYAETEVFEIYVKVFENYLEDVLASLDSSIDGYINELDIYN